MIVQIGVLIGLVNAYYFLSEWTEYAWAATVLGWVATIGVVNFLISLMDYESVVTKYEGKDICAKICLELQETIATRPLLGATAGLLMCISVALLGIFTSFVVLCNIGFVRLMI